MDEKVLFRQFMENRRREKEAASNLADTVGDREEEFEEEEREEKYAKKSFIVVKIGSRFFRMEDGICLPSAAPIQFGNCHRSCVFKEISFQASAVCGNLR